MMIKKWGTIIIILHRKGNNVGANDILYCLGINLYWFLSVTKNLFQVSKLKYLEVIDDKLYDCFKWNCYLLTYLQYIENFGITWV